MHGKVGVDHKIWGRAKLLANDPLPFKATALQSITRIIARKEDMELLRYFVVIFSSSCCDSSVVNINNFKARMNTPL